MERNSFAGTDGWIIGGPKGMLAPPPPLKLLGAWPPWPPFFLRLCNKTERVVYLGDYALPVIEIHPYSKSIEGRGIEVFTF